MVINERCEDYFAAVTQITHRFPFSAAEEFRQLIHYTMDINHVIYVAGNGGGATVADHFALGMSLNLLRETGRGSRAFSLSSGIMLSAAVNDFGYEDMFATQLATLGKPTDLFIAISASGKSNNMVSAIDRANTLSMNTVAIVGQEGSVSEKADLVICLDTDNPALAEDVTMMMLHWVYCSFMR